MFNKPTAEAGLLNKSYYLAAALGGDRFLHIIAIKLVALCSTA
jgi:hypothetical protein